MQYSNAFEKAVDHEMLYEVGGFWKLTPDVEAGLIDTVFQRQACGYTTDSTDRGGETKYGIAKSGNPDLDIANLDWDGAKRVYFKNYWLGADCQNLPYRLAALHFDSGINHGIGRAAKFLQRAVGAIEDGDIGPGTISLIVQNNEIDICNTICEYRVQYYNDIVSNNPTQSKYLNGWMRRIEEMRVFTTNLSNSFE